MLGRQDYKNFGMVRTEIIMTSKKDENEKTGRSCSMRSFANHVKEFGFYSKEFILSKDFRPLFLELAISN